MKWSGVRNLAVWGDVELGGFAGFYGKFLPFGEGGPALGFGGCGGVFGEDGDFGVELGGVADF